VLSVKRALPAYSVAPIVPLTAPLHEIVSVADAPVADNVAQLIGLLANDPLTLPPVIVTAALPVMQCDNSPFTVEGLLPPPDVVIGGENLTVADNTQLSDPGGAPTNLGGTFADVGDAVPSTAPAANAVAATDTRRLIPVNRPAMVDTPVPNRVHSKSTEHATTRSGVPFPRSGQKYLNTILRSSAEPKVTSGEGSSAMSTLSARKCT